MFFFINGNWHIYIYIDCTQIFCFLNKYSDYVEDFAPTMEYVDGKGDLSSSIWETTAGFSGSSVPTLM